MTKLKQAARQALDWIDANAPRYVFEAVEKALAEQAEQEPVAWMNEERNTITWNELYPNMTPLYTAPVRTKDLTDDEILEITKRFALGIAFPVDGVTTPEMFARAVIAADREKNK